ncbi:MAG: tRNA (adenosine(37)-N6)-threonylcarbamoyltransferase complex ATPase subunit type 1 TsaE [Clostridia bacterium]|nr:tRNA (adenosine(37)-N6)-threonylcarbamoyltransferase complex ATPase subunit type 1 TsaE [Clostridia bacterium]
MWKITSHAPVETLELGRILGASAPAGTVFALRGDLGAGKTLFAKGLAMGLEIPDYVSSPTFTIVNEYLEGEIPFYHMDIYRVNDEEELLEIGVEEYFQEGGIVAVEWPDILGGILPKEHININFAKEYDEEGNEWREITIDAAIDDSSWLEEVLYTYAHTIH